MTGDGPTTAAQLDALAVNRAAASPLGRFTTSRAGVLGAIVLAILGLIALLAPVIAATSPLRQAFDPLQAPSLGHLFGTDELGRDIFSRVVYGSRVSLLTAAGAATIAAGIGVPMGLVGGYYGGWIDAIEMRLVDFVLSVPGIVFALVIIAILGSGELNMLLAIGIVSVPAFARLARASTLVVRELEYVQAARAMAASDPDIMARTILPNIMGPIIVQIVVTASVAILVSAALSFLGLGAPPPNPSWGGMLQTSRTYLYEAPWYGIFPGLALAVTIGALDGLGSGLQVALGSRSTIEAKSRGFA